MLGGVAEPPSELLSVAAYRVGEGIRPTQPARAADDLVAEEDRQLALLLLGQGPALGQPGEQWRRITLDLAECVLDVVDHVAVRSLPPVRATPGADLLSRHLKGLPVNADGQPAFELPGA